MPFRDILLVLEAGSDKAQSFALSLAGLDRAHVTAVVPSQDPPLPGYLRGELGRDVIDAISQQQRQADAALAARFEGAAKLAGANAETLILRGQSGGLERDFAGLARHFDVTILEQADPDRPRHDGLLEAALFESGRPLLMVPYVHTEPAKLETVLVAWDHSRQAARAIADAMPVLARARAVELVTVANGAKTGVDLPGFNIARHLARHGISVELKRLTNAGDVGNTLLSYAADRGADLLVMGGYGHSRFRELIIGGTTRTVMGTMTLPVLFAH